MVKFRSSSRKSPKFCRFLLLMASLDLRSVSFVASLKSIFNVFCILLFVCGTETALDPITLIILPSTISYVTELDEHDLLLSILSPTRRLPFLSFFMSFNSTFDSKHHICGRLINGTSLNRAEPGSSHISQLQI